MLDFSITRYKVQFQALIAIQFPDYAGAILRNAFGEALKHLVCHTVHHHGYCQCDPVERCLYRQLFAPVHRELKNQQRSIDVPPPFIIEAYGLKKLLSVGEVAQFYMVLIGDLAHQQKKLIEQAWKIALSFGLQQHKKLDILPQAKLLSFQFCDQPQRWLDPQSELQLNIITHLRLQYYGQFLHTKNFDLQVFCRAVIRRYLTVVETYSDINVCSTMLQNIDYQIKKIEGSAALEWLQWSRYNKRQFKSMSLDGLHGSVQVKNVSDELYYYLYLGQWLHVGKGCVFGLGQYQIVSYPQEHRTNGFRENLLIEI